MKEKLVIVVAVVLLFSAVPSVYAKKVYYSNVPIGFLFTASFTVGDDNALADFKEVMTEYGDEFEEEVEEAVLDKIQRRQQRDLSIRNWKLSVDINNNEIEVELEMDVMDAVYEEGDHYHALVKWRDVNCYDPVEIENKYGRILTVNPAVMLGFRWIEFSNNIHEGWDTEQKSDCFILSEEQEWDYEGNGYSGEETITVPFSGVSEYREDKVESPNEPTAKTSSSSSSSEGESEEDDWVGDVVDDLFGEEGIPGFPAEGVLAGLLLALVTVIGRRKKCCVVA